jgi:hypothetical protein
MEITRESSKKITTATLARKFVIGTASLFCMFLLEQDVKFSAVFEKGVSQIQVERVFEVCFAHFHAGKCS